MIVNTLFPTLNPKDLRFATGHRLHQTMQLSRTVSRSEKCRMQLMPQSQFRAVLSLQNAPVTCCSSSYFFFGGGNYLGIEHNLLLLQKGVMPVEILVSVVAKACPATSSLLNAPL